MTRARRPSPRGSEDGLLVSELFESVQGEGPSAGLPSLFLRLALCNLRCDFCDTKYTWDFKHYDYDAEVRRQSVEALRERLVASTVRRLVVTGGEPLLQQAALARLFDALGPEFFVEIETNGTLVPEPSLAARVNQWNVSPKLANSGEPGQRRVRPAALAALRATGRAYLKLVSRGGDAQEAEELAIFADFPRDRVFLMAEASSRRELAARGPIVRAEALARGFRYSPRLHVERWDGARGV